MAGPGAVPTGVWVPAGVPVPAVGAGPSSSLPDLRAAVPRSWAGSEGAAGSAAPAGCAGRGWVSQATAAPVRATGHSTTPAAPSTPAPA
ncbi:hypothetical protein C3492_32435 [Streptomyces sp. Ru62]|nr:hypothetical protein C3492_32435 [Streptomyces sp. Ru62]